jgi:hypothetical protein
VAENPQKMSVAATFLEAAGNSFLENQENNNSNNNNNKEAEEEGRERERGGGEDQLTDLSELFVSYSSQMTAGSSNKKSSSSGKKTSITVEEAKDFLVGNSQSLFADYISNSTQYYRERNLPVNSFSLNGILSVEPALSQSLMRLLGREQFLLSSYVRRGLLTDKSQSVFADIMRLTPSVFSRYHPMIDEKEPALVDLSGVGWEGLQRMKDGRTAFFTPFLSLADYQHSDSDNKKNKNQNEMNVVGGFVDGKGQQHHGGQQQQMTMKGGKDLHLSVSAERRFFDQLKDALLSISRDHWAEFVKCLELFTDDKINKDELLKLVVDLLGEQGDLLNEFKRLLDNRMEYQENKEDIWFSVPLSEIDFTQCRKCTPSYRALPRDYPRPKCSERSEEEEKLLNDVVREKTPQRNKRKSIKFLISLYFFLF